MFIIDLQIRVCYGEEICQVQSSILDRTEIPQVLCILEDLKSMGLLVLKEWDCLCCVSAIEGMGLSVLCFSN